MSLCSHCHAEGHEFYDCPLRPPAAMVALRPYLAKPNPEPPKPRWYSPAIHDAIVKHVSAGVMPATAAEAEGVLRPEWHAAVRAVKDGSAHYVVAQLMRDVARASASEEARLTKEISAGAIDPKQKLEFLKHRFADNWSSDLKKTAAELERVVFDKIVNAFQSGKLTEAEYDKFLDVLASE